MSLNHETTMQESITEEQAASFIVEVTRQVFQTMVMLEPADDYPLADPITHFNCSITGMVGFVGSYSGLVSIHCPIELANEITASMLGVEKNDLDKEGADLNDAIGELANILAGSIKQLLSKGGMDIKLSIPTMISGEEYTITTLSDQDCVVIPFTVQDRGRFLVGLTLHKDEE